MSLPKPDAQRATVITRGHSCLTCSARKVRCDGQRPCTTCLRSDVQCLSKPTRSAQAIIAKRGRERVKVSKTPKDCSPNVTEDQSTIAEHINDQGHSRYVENVMWVGVGKELPGSTSKEYSEIDLTPTPLTNTRPFAAERLVLGGSVVNLSDQHPDPGRVIWLWQTFLENVNPPAKMLHIPTVQKMILDVNSNLVRTIPANKEALCFAIYLIAICSVPQHQHNDCESVMGQPVNELIILYTELAQQALVNACFMRNSNFITLQAFALFLVAQRAKSDPQTLWQLTGLAIRSAQQMGYHREQALRSPSVSVFQAELRRRLWWELVLLESFAAKQCGVKSIVSSRSLWDTERPLNINDSDLHPEMRNSPEDYRGITEMSFCSARFEIGSFTIDHSNMDKASQNIEEVDARIEELQKHLDDRLLKYCDPSVPMHCMIQLFGRSALARVKLTVRRHHMYAKAVGLSIQERDKTFLLCLQLIETPNSFAKNKEIQRFLWQANAFFPLDALLFMLGEMAYRTEQPLPNVEHAWEEIEKSYELQLRLLHDESNAMYSAVRNLTLKAWERSTNGQDAAQAAPRFIQLLRSKLSTTSASVAKTIYVLGGPSPTTSFSNIAANTLDENEFDFDTESVDPSWSKIIIPDDPEFWEYWQQFASDMPGLSTD